MTQCSFSVHKYRSPVNAISSLVQIMLFRREFCLTVTDRSKAEMDLKELSETVQQKQGATPVLTSPKRQIKSRFQLNLDKTIESCKAQLGQ